jgi:adenylosuccinate synthase
MTFKSNFLNKNNAVVIGLQFGDEGKGKVVDLLAKGFDIVARFQGGDNAGHTIVINGVTHKLSLIPSGVFHGKKVVLGSGVVINPYKLEEEIKVLKEKNIDLTEKLFISDNASIIFSVHRKFDLLNEKLRSEAIGTTGKGIGVCYSQRVSRVALRVCDLFNDHDLRPRLIGMISEYNALIKSCESQDFYNKDDVFHEVLKFREILKDYIVNSSYFFQTAISCGEKIMFEGAQGCGLDILHGTYPFVTSSSTFAAQVALGAPIAFHDIGKVYGVLKAYSTRVGNGIFVTEDYTDKDIKLKMLNVGKEFGTVTGRTRRCGWLDLFLVRHYAKLNGVNSIVLTKLDILDDFKKIKVCIGYKVDGKVLEYFPSITDQTIVPIYIEMDGWVGQSVINIKKYVDLPENAKKYIEFIENFISIPIEIISNGADRDAIIYKVST